MEDRIYKGTSGAFAFRAGDMDDVEAIEIARLERIEMSDVPDIQSAQIAYGVADALNPVAHLLYGGLSHHLHPLSSTFVYHLKPRLGGIQPLHRILFTVSTLVPTTG